MKSLRKDKIKGALFRSSGGRYLQIFLYAFVIMLVILLPMVIYNGGYFLYYGDFNSQQLPFYSHVSSEIRSGGLLGWDWGTDLGSSLIGGYSFYNVTSPFFWLTFLFPAGATLTLIPFLLALKTGVAALTSFAYIKRFVKNDSACMIGAMLYAFSGFLAYNVFFNHFHDAVCLFPLMLLALEIHVNDGKKGVFALSTALCAAVNYYFFISEVVFVIIYFIIRCFDKGFLITKTKFFTLFLEAFLGTLAACAVLVPSYFAIADNPRVSATLSGLDMVVYDDKYRILRIIQSFFMMPDPPARSNLFSSDTARWSSIAGYLPMFSLAGVIAFFRCRRSHWASRLVGIMCVIAFVPVFNSAFQLFSRTYYARWFFMPILIMCMMTASAFESSKNLEDRPIDLKKGVPACIAAVLIFFVIFLLPVENEEGEYEFFKIAQYESLFWIQIGVSVLLTAALVFVVYFLKRKKGYRKKVLWITLCACAVSMAVSVYYGVSQGPYPDKYIEKSIEGGENISLSGDGFFRIDTSENTDNWPMFWGYSTMRCFNSTVSTSIMKFYDLLGMDRNVASRVETKYYALRSLFSVKYYLNENESLYNSDSSDFEMEGFVYKDTQNGFDVYENENYIPMGFVYDCYVTEEEFKEQSTENRVKILMKALVLTEEQIEKYGGILKHYDIEKSYYGNASFIDECSYKKENCCSSFEYDSGGFTAQISLDSQKLVFFSVPYDKGFKATVNGKEAEVIQVDGGMTAVRCEAGANDIVFEYELYGFRLGLVLSITGLVVLAAYVFISKRISRGKKNIDKVVSID